MLNSQKLPGTQCVYRGKINVIENDEIIVFFSSSTYHIS